jgi:Mn-dependent DtxR family transcriptional regulator
MNVSTETVVPREVVLGAFERLTELGYAITDGKGGYDLTDDGRDWMLMAIWVRLGCAGFPQSWYDDFRSDAF